MISQWECTTFLLGSQSGDVVPVLQSTYFCRLDISELMLAHSGRKNTQWTVKYEKQEVFILQLTINYISVKRAIFGILFEGAAAVGRVIVGCLIKTTVLVDAAALLSQVRPKKY